MSGKPAEKRELLKLVGVKRHFQVRGGG